MHFATFVFCYICILSFCICMFVFRFLFFHLCILFRFCQTRPKLTNSTDLNSASADQLGPDMALISVSVCPSNHPSVQPPHAKLVMTHSSHIKIFTAQEYPIMTLRTQLIYLTNSIIVYVIKTQLKTRFGLA